MALRPFAQKAMQLDPFAGGLFAYVGKRFNALKILCWSATDLTCGTSGLRASGDFTGRGRCRSVRNGAF